MFLWTCAPFTVAIFSFTAYILVDETHVLDAQTAFVSITYFDLLRLPLNQLPNLLIYLVQCSVSLRRVNRFMNAEELDPLNVSREEKPSDCPVSVDGASFTWGRDNQVGVSPAPEHSGRDFSGRRDIYVGTLT
jgi:ATP-binding cassette subfamily C (CFTR/MRP) protein 1